IQTNIKEKIINDIEENTDRYIETSHDIHGKPEIGNEEFYASGLLINLLEDEGFIVEKEVAGHKTAFVARKKSVKSGPTIAFLAEYDALPELGHACGHNVIGTMSVAAAIAFSKVIDDVRIHGIITHGGDAPNIVPDYAKARFYIRAATRTRLNNVTKRIKAIAEGAALATGAELNVIAIQNEVDNLLLNDAYNEVFKEVIEELGETITEGAGMGSTDAGNIS